MNIMTKDEIEDTRHTGWNYGWYDDDAGSNNPHDEDSDEFLIYQLGYFEGLRDRGFTLTSENLQFIDEKTKWLKELISDEEYSDEDEIEYSIRERDFYEYCGV